MNTVKTAYDDFCHVSTPEGDGGFDVILHQHPEMGRWEERRMELSSVHVSEHRTHFDRPLDVCLTHQDVHEKVHYCASLDGVTSVLFPGTGLRADLQPGYYHHLAAPEKEYSLKFGTAVHSIHIEFKREYYAEFLSDSEKWSSELKSAILDRRVYYPGEFLLTPVMSKSIHEIFNSPLSGTLKRLLVEAKVQELAVLQLNYFRTASTRKTTSRFREVLVAIHDYLKCSFLEDHSLRSICKKFGINEFDLKKGFKEMFNTSVFDFLLSLRMEHAYCLLTSTDTTIREVSGVVGYKYPNHFSTAFKKRFGVNPKELTLQPLRKI